MRTKSERRHFVSRAKSKARVVARLMFDNPEHIENWVRKNHGNRKACSCGLCSDYGEPIQSLRQKFNFLNDI
jgi:hypothetical protein